MAKKIEMNYNDNGTYVPVYPKTHGLIVETNAITDATNVDEALSSLQSTIANLVQVGTVSLSTSWSGSGPFTQVVTVSSASVTANSKVDLQLTPSQTSTLINEKVSAIQAVNDNGSVTVYAYGKKPTTAIGTVQVLITEAQ